jgi:hypothetical protein
LKLAWVDIVRQGRLRALRRDIIVLHSLFDRTKKRKPRSAPTFIVLEAGTSLDKEGKQRHSLTELEPKTKNKLHAVLQFYPIAVHSVLVVRGNPSTATLSR